MTDIRIINSVTLEATTMDWLLQPDGTLDESNELATAICVALGTDMLASQDEVLPDPDSTDRRGWWGNYQAEEIWNGWSIGGRHWLLRRAKISDAVSSEGSTLQRAVNYTQDALQPFVDQKICTSFTVEAERIGDTQIDVIVRIYRGPLNDIDLRFQILWPPV
jgi:phage gp46-like protein